MSLCSAERRVADVCNQGNIRIFFYKVSRNEYMKNIFEVLGIFSATAFICCKVSVATMGKRKLHYSVMSATYPEFVTKNTQFQAAADNQITEPVSQLFTVGAHFWDNPVGVTRT